MEEEKAKRIMRIYDTVRVSLIILIIVLFFSANL